MTVVAAGIRDPAGRFLLQKALPGKAHAGQWEFPGGKVDAGETPRAALIREINEELGLALDPEALEPAGFADESRSGASPPIVLIFYSCVRWEGEPEARESQDWGWFAPKAVSDLPLAPLDRLLFTRFAAGVR
ncbi:MAG: hypothetical protein B7Z33_13340 [Sphingomonadales bacterium 12-68-11]|nr:MAG: hypothetical protein B7Z33_13340 [Sphingomonadales bacterium 12-68-11]OYX16783.1 MAG: hypothetical protein B7Z07_02005 [Sphingomonadales bacterium 32-67-7]